VIEQLVIRHYILVELSLEVQGDRTTPGLWKEPV